MIWTKQKALVEDLLAETLKKRIKYHRTRYGPGESFLMNRGWVTLDKNEILTCSTIKSIVNMQQLTGVWYSNDKQPLERLHRLNIFTLDDFEDAIQSVIDSNVEQLLTSESPLIRAFGMFDRRLGKRRLREIDILKDEYAVVIDFYKIRCEAEGIKLGQ